VRSQQMNELIERLETFQLPCVVGLDMNAEPPHVPVLALSISLSLSLSLSPVCVVGLDMNAEPPHVPVLALLATRITCCTC
jgi:hypothetical protein